MWGTKAQTHQQETRADKLPAQPPVQAGALADHFFNVVTESVHSWNIWRYFDTFERHVLRISKQCKDSRWLKYHCGVIFNKPLQFLLHHSFFFFQLTWLYFFLFYFFIHAWKASLTEKEYVQTHCQVFSTAQCIYPEDSGTKDHSGQRSKVPLSSYEDGGKKDPPSRRLDLSGLPRSGPTKVVQYADPTWGRS